MQTSLIDGAFEDCMIIRVPPTCSITTARELEQKMTQELGKNCIVVSRNIEFCSVELVDPKEMVHVVRNMEEAQAQDESLRQVNLGPTLSAMAALHTQETP